MPNDVSGVYPVYENQFQVNTAASGSTAAFSDIADMESFSVSIDNNVEEWTPFTTEGWTRRLMTGPTPSSKRLFVPPPPAASALCRWWPPTPTAKPSCSAARFPS